MEDSGSGSTGLFLDTYIVNGNSKSHRMRLFAMYSSCWHFGLSVEQHTV
jgi:hypothetical protein